jgi:N-methylhydantoinase B
MMDVYRRGAGGALARSSSESSLAATRAVIAKLPRGDLRGGNPLGRLRGAGDARGGAMTVGAEEIVVDFAGTSGCPGAAINVPPAYCRAYSCFGIKCVVAPESRTTGPASPVPHGDPGGLHPQRPAALPGQRAATGRTAAARLMMGCLAQAVPERVNAEGASALWNPPLRGGSQVSGPAAEVEDFEVITFNSGGTGARPGADGLDGIAFPPACGPCRWRRRRTSRR